MKYNCRFIFTIPLLFSACQPSGSNIPTQPVPPLSQTEPGVVIQFPSSTPFPTTIPSQTPVPSTTATLPLSLSSLRVVFSDGKNVGLWQNGVAALITTIEGYTDVMLSYDGELVAFKRDGLLWVAHSDGTGEWLLVSADNLKTIEPELNDDRLVVHQFDWIPGTHNLLFNTTITGYGMSNRDDLFMVDAGTLEWKIVRDAGEGGRFLLSPNGKHVILVTPHEISLMNIDGTNYRSVLKYSQIDTGSEYYEYVDPVWFADSQSLIVDIPPRDYKDNPATALKVIWRLFVDGSHPVQISQVPAKYRYVFSSDFSELAYHELKNNVIQTHIANIDGSEDQIYEPGIDMYIEGWSPDSEYFILNSRYSGQYFLGRVEDEPVPLTEKGSQDFLWVDEMYFLYKYKNIHNEACELRLGAIRKPSVLLATFALDPASSYCFRPYDFVQ